VVLLDDTRHNSVDSSLSNPNPFESRVLVDRLRPVMVVEQRRWLPSSFGSEVVGWVRLRGKKWTRWYDWKIGRCCVEVGMEDVRETLGSVHGKACLGCKKTGSLEG
jgi:hypothetical protein